MVGEVLDRCQTGIKGFDIITQGGFIRNSNNVIVGGPGSGKSTFLLNFLWNSINQFQENGLYCSFEPDVLEVLEDGQSFGWDFYKLSEEGRIKFIKFSPETSINELKKELTKIIAQNDIKRICFDPVSVLALNLSERGKIRETIFELISLMKRLKVTSVLADESMENESEQGFKGGEWTKTDIIRFLADSVTVFYSSGIAGSSDRAIRVEKMRRTNHIRTPIPMVVMSTGIQIGQ